MAKLIGFGRCLGKTTMAILESHATGNQIICANNRIARNTSAYALQLGYTIPQPVSINNPSLKEIINNLNRAHIGVVVDDILGAMIIIASLMVLLLAIVVSGWRVIFKNEQENQKEES